MQAVKAVRSTIVGPMRLIGVSNIVFLRCRLTSSLIEDCCVCFKRSNGYSGDWLFHGIADCDSAASTGSVFFATDGSQPTTSSLLYSAPLVVSTPTQVNGVAYSSGTYSAVTTALQLWIIGSID